MTVGGQVCKVVMEKAILAKFMQNKHLTDVLLSTGSKDIVEASPHDTYWGAGVNMRNIVSTPKEQWPGHNELGQLLMKARDMITGK